MLYNSFYISQSIFTADFSLTICLQSSRVTGEVKNLDQNTTIQIQDKHEQDIGYMIKVLHDTLEKHANEDLRESGLTLSQLRVMSFIAKNNNQTTQKAIEAFLAVSHPTVNGLLKRLESKGMIQTEIAVNHRLTKNVVMTEKGKKECQFADSRRHEHEKMLRDCLTEEERQTLLTLLQRIYVQLAAS